VDWVQSWSVPEKTSSEKMVIADAHMPVKRSGSISSGVILPWRRRKCGHFE
jgi:hypothetical protein